MRLPPPTAPTVDRSGQVTAHQVRSDSALMLFALFEGEVEHIVSPLAATQ